MQLLAKFKKILYMRFIATLNFRKCTCTEFFKKVASYPAYQNSITRKNLTVSFLRYKRLKLKLRVFLACHSVAMVTYYVTKIIPTCSPVIGQFFLIS